MGGGGEVVGDPGPLELVGEFGQQRGGLAEAVGEMTARLGDGLLLPVGAGQDLRHSDGFGIGDQVACRRLPPAGMSVVGTRGFNAGRPLLFLGGPGLVPPGSGDGAGYLESLCCGGGAVQQPDMPPLGLDDLRAPAKGYGQAAGAG
ncbi:hypothetical protein ACFC0R_00020 [Streptomyces sp. NPDC056086]|uniref:hypothetical protein n=1 Tax=Streptomyces sp. NPDC056086 TaxID=3345709 RepID=UPI0035DF1898